jgi:predicted P-loop ATPase
MSDKRKLVYFDERYRVYVHEGEVPSITIEQLAQADIHIPLREVRMPVRKWLEAVDVWDDVRVLKDSAERLLGKL